MNLYRYVYILYLKINKNMSRGNFSTFLVPPIHTQLSLVSRVTSPGRGATKEEGDGVTSTDGAPVSGVDSGSH